MAAKRQNRGRAVGGRSAKPTLLIVCEGETELSSDGENPVFGRPVTYVDTLVGRIAEVSKMR